MQLAGHDIERWFAIIAGAGAAFFTIVKLIRNGWRFFWTVAKAVISEVVDPKFDNMGSKITSLDHYTRYHLGPNDVTKPVYKRIERIEHDNEVIKMRQVAQHRENRATLVEVDRKVTPSEPPEGQHHFTDQELIDRDTSRDARRDNGDDMSAAGDDQATG